jgi:predicted PurR-regulated permease PerM
MTSKSLQLPPYLKALAVLSLLIVVVFILIVGKAILIPLALGAFFAILFTPFSLFLEKYRFPRILSSLISLVLMIGSVAGLLSFIVSNLISFSTDFEDVTVRITQLIQQVDQFTSTQFGFKQKLANQLDPDVLLNLLKKNSSNISSFTINAIGSLSSLILIPVFMFFFLLYRDHLVSVLVSIFKNTDPAEVKAQTIRLRKVVLNYISGVGKVMVILAILNITAYSLIGVEHAIFFGIIGAMLNIIPYVGPLIGALLPMSYAFLTMDNLLSPLLILGAYQAIQVLEGNILTPKIVGSQVNLNAFITFLGLLLGASIWGVAGMVLIIPILAILREIFDLSSSTKPFALLLGEEPKAIAPKPTSDENSNS